MKERAGGEDSILFRGIDFLIIQSMRIIASREEKRKRAFPEFLKLSPAGKKLGGREKEEGK